MMGVKASEEPEITEEEIKALIRQGTESGVFEEAEHEMVQRVFRLGDRPIKSMMTPRTEIAWLDLDDKEKESSIIAEVEAGVKFQYHTRVASAYRDGRRLTTIVTDSMTTGVVGRSERSVATCCMASATS